MLHGETRMGGLEQRVGGLEQRTWGGGKKWHCGPYEGCWGGQSPATCWVLGQPVAPNTFPLLQGCWGRWGSSSSPTTAPALWQGSSGAS